MNCIRHHTESRRAKKLMMGEIFQCVVVQIFTDSRHQLRVAGNVLVVRRDRQRLVGHVILIPIGACNDVAR